MRRARLSYPGSFHHIMCRGYQGNPVFRDRQDKIFLQECWRKYATRQKVSLLSWCILDNHYHLVLTNPQDTLSRFMREVNGSWGIHYRSLHGGRGVVFDGRFRSTLIEDTEYLAASVLYLLRNPVRAGLVEAAELYPWSSLGELRGHEDHPLVDLECFRQLLGEPDEFLLRLSAGGDVPQSFRDRWGESQGSVVHRFHALHASNRRVDSPGLEKDRRRIEDRRQGKAGEQIQNFLQDEAITMEELRARTWVAARLRRKLLLILRDRVGLRLGEIHRLEPFRHLSRNSLGPLYCRAATEWSLHDGECTG